MVKLLNPVQKQDQMLIKLLSSADVLAVCPIIKLLQVFLK